MSRAFYVYKQRGEELLNASWQRDRNFKSFNDNRITDHSANTACNFPLLSKL
jgi:hypothetical protein